MRYLGIDFGTKRVGLALSDEAGTMGFPHATLQNTTRLLEEVRAVIAKEAVDAVVIGESRDFQGKENKVAQEAKEFARALTTQSGVPVFFEPEMLTTQEARRDMEGARTVGAVDASAAALILTSYLSRTHD